MCGVDARKKKKKRKGEDGDERKRKYNPPPEKPIGNLDVKYKAGGNIILGENNTVK